MSLYHNYLYKLFAFVVLISYVCSIELVIKNDQMNHSKGNWIIYNSNRRPYAVTANHGFINICYFQEDDIPLREQRANAKLIAASPKLLKALINLVSICPMTALSKRERDAAHALINKLSK